MVGSDTIVSFQTFLNNQKSPEIILNFGMVFRLTMQSKVKQFVEKFGTMVLSYFLRMYYFFIQQWRYILLANLIKQQKFMKLYPLLVFKPIVYVLGLSTGKRYEERFWFKLLNFKPKIKITYWKRNFFIRNKRSQIHRLC